MATSAQYRLEDYEDIVVTDRFDVDEIGLSTHGDYLIGPRQHSPRYYGHNVVTIPVLSAVSPQLPTVEAQSLSLVLRHIKRAPVAYLRFMSILAFMTFVASLIFYLAFQTVLFNPLLAVFGALGSLLTLGLVEATLLVEKRNRVRN